MGNLRSFRRKQLSSQEKKGRSKGKPLGYTTNNRLASAMRRKDWLFPDDARALPSSFTQYFHVGGF